MKSFKVTKRDIEVAIDDEDTLEEDIEDLMSDENLTRSEAIVASRNYRFENMPDDYKDAIVTLSYRVACPRCRAKKLQICRGTAQNRAPAHKVRLRLLKFKNKKVSANLIYAMNSRTWVECDWNKLVKEMQEYRESGQQEIDDEEMFQRLTTDTDHDSTLEY